MLLDRPRSKTSTTSELHERTAFVETFVKEIVVMPCKPVTMRFVLDL